MAQEPKKRRIDDAGEKILGARKDWKASHMTSEDVATMTDEEIAENVKKDNIWPKPDFAQLVADGMTPLVAASIKVIRDRMAQEPRAYAKYNPIDIRRSFVGMTSAIRDAAMSATKVEDLEELYRKIESQVGGSFKTPENYSGYISVFKGRSCPFYFTVTDKHKALDLVREGFPEKTPVWKTGVKVIPYAGAYAVILNGKFLHKEAATADIAWKWAEVNVPALKTARKKAKPAEPSRPHLDYLSRSGMPFSLENQNVSSDDFLETFGFRGVQFGNWLPDDERQKVLNIGYEALMDLADILDIDPKALSLGNTLAIAFGARGTGKAAAHYEAGQRVVNMTRINGAGSLAHEYAHAFDHWAGSAAGVAPTGGIPSATGWRHLISSEERRNLLQHRGEEVAVAWERLMDKIMKTPITRDMRVQRLEGRLAKAEEDLRKNAENISKSTNAHFIRKATQWARENEPRVETLRGLIAETKAADASKTYGYEDSEFLKEALKISGTGDYWKRPNELFARAFESWVYDEIAAREGSSQYLVHGVEGDRYQEGYKGNPYPSGEERLLINETMREMAQAMKPVVEMSLESARNFSMK